jgi:HEAT repeat protein
VKALPPVVVALGLALASVLVCGCGKSEEESAEDIILKRGASKSEVEKLAAKGVPHLKKLLDSDSQLTRMTAIDALGYLKDDPEATQLLLEQTRSQTPNDQYSALVALAHQGAPQTKELILQFFKDENPYLREAACVAVGVYGDKSLYPLLDRAMRDENLTVQTVAGGIKEKYGID